MEYALFIMFAIDDGPSQQLTLDPKVAMYETKEACEAAGFQMTQTLLGEPNKTWVWSCLPRV